MALFTILPLDNIIQWYTLFYSRSGRYVVFDMKRYKIIKMLEEAALCERNTEKVYILTRDLPPGAQAGDQLIQDRNGKLHICNITTPAE